jgi:VanZ family protein
MTPSEQRKAGTQLPALRPFSRRRFWLRTLILLWVIGLLLPLAFLSQFWPPCADLFNQIFSPAWMHVLMHALLYAILAFLLALWNPPTSLQKLAILLAVVVLFGVLQEALQILTRGFWPGLGAELFDLVVDLGGAILGLVTWRLGRQNRSRLA